MLVIKEEILLVLSKQEKLGIVNFILTVIAIILIKYLSIYIPWLPTASDGSVEIIPFVTITIIAVLFVHIITWILLARYFTADTKNSKKMLFVYEIVFLSSLVFLYISTVYDFIPEFIRQNMLAGIGLFIIMQMVISLFFTQIVSKIQTKQ